MRTTRRISVSGARATSIRRATQRWAPVEHLRVRGAMLRDDGTTIVYRQS